MNADGLSMPGDPLYETYAFHVEGQMLIPRFVWHGTWQELLKHHARPIVAKECKSGTYIVIPKGKLTYPLRSHKDVDTAMMEAVLRLSQEDNSVHSRTIRVTQGPYTGP